MLRDRLEIKRAFSLLLKGLGYSVDDIWKPYALMQFNASYENMRGMKDNLKVDLNFLERMPVLGVRMRAFSHPFDIPDFKVQSYAAEELFAGKIRALLTRSKARDLYDADMIFKSSKRIDFRLLRGTTLFYLAMQSQDPRTMGPGTINKITKGQVNDELLPMLSSGEKIDLDSMRQNVIGLAADILNMTDTERTFFDKLYRERRVDPNILFEGLPVSGGLEGHPSIAWQLHQLEYLDANRENRQM